MPHGKHSHQSESDMNMATMCDYPTPQHELPHWNCVLRFCDNCPRIDIPSQELDKRPSNKRTTITFHVYQLIERCTLHVRLQIDKKKI